MLIKYIECVVEQSMKDSFSIAQQQWNTTVKSKGFLGQFGGWNFTNNQEACILSFWETKEDLDFFMKTLHDEIVEQNKQSETYLSIQVFYFITDEKYFIERPEFFKELNYNKQFIINTINDFIEIDSLDIIKLLTTDNNFKKSSNSNLLKPSKKFEKKVILDKLWTVLH